MEQKREWKGITVNIALLEGKVIEDPIFATKANGEKCAFLKLRTFVNEMGANGQWTENAIIIPLIVLDQKKVAVVEEYIKQERCLFVRCYYKAWKDSAGNDKHGMVVTNIQLGSKGFLPQKNNEDIGGVPPMPD